MADKELLIFPTLSGILCLIVCVSFFVPLSMADKGVEHLYNTNQTAFIAGAFLFYFLNYFLITFFNCAVIACAEIRMSGGDPSLGDGFSAAFAVIGYIALWAIIEATVGLLLRMLKGRNRRSFVTGSLGTLWTMASFFVAPRMVIDRINPFTALRSAWNDVKSNWGHQLVAGVSFGLIGVMASIPAFLFVYFTGAASIAAMVAGVMWVLIVALLVSALKSIFQASLYLTIQSRG